jgi:chorismate mutase/prephenate dehydratase
MNETHKTRPLSLSESADAELEQLRARIDAIDQRILAQLNERARTVQAVGGLKRTTGAPVYSAPREQEILARVVAENSGPFPSAALAPIFREIISACRTLEAPLRIAFLGPEGTNSHLAAREEFGVSATLEAVPSIAAVFAAVERGQADLGVVPVENSTEGVVTQTLDAFVDSELTLCGEVVIRISYHLLSRSGRIEEVRRVVSHPQGLAQCRGWLDAHLPHVERSESASTAAAARLAAEDAGVAAIAGAIAGEVYGLRTIESSIEDRRDNTTRFLLIGRTPPPPSGCDLTCAVFTVRKDESGALYKLLEPFAREGVNLTAIQARPIKGKPWEYLFYLDVEGHPSEERVGRALADAARRAHSHKVLGSFPRASARPRRAGAVAGAR